MAKVLLFQCKDELAMRRILTPMKVRVISVPKEKFGQTLGELAGGKRAEPSAEGAVEEITAATLPEGSLLVMCDFTEKQMNRLLFELRKQKVSVTFKAVLTPTNRNWTVQQMYREMERERAMYAARSEAAASLKNE